VRAVRAIFAVSLLIYNFPCSRRALLLLLQLQLARGPLDSRSGTSGLFDPSHVRTARINPQGDKPRTPDRQ